MKPEIRPAPSVGNRVNKHTVFGLRVDHGKRKVCDQTPAGSTGRRLAVERVISSALRRSLDRRPEPGSQAGLLGLVVGKLCKELRALVG